MSIKLVVLALSLWAEWQLPLIQSISKCKYSLLKCAPWSFEWSSYWGWCVSIKRTCLSKMLDMATLLQAAKMIHQWKQLALLLRWLAGTIQVKSIMIMPLYWIVRQLTWYESLLSLKKTLLLVRGWKMTLNSWNLVMEALLILSQEIPCVLRVADSPSLGSFSVCSWHEADSCSECHQSCEQESCWSWQGQGVCLEISEGRKNITPNTYHSILTQWWKVSNLFVTIV